LYNFFKYTKRKESKKDLRCWSSYISNPLVVVVYFTIHGTLIFLFIAQHVRNFDLKKGNKLRALEKLVHHFCARCFFASPSAGADNEAVKNVMM
jgi:hypothetical protein